MKSLWLTGALLLTVVPLRAETQAPALPSTANWKVYRNAPYGFQFKYPPQFQLQEKLKLKIKTVFSTSINSGLFSVTLMDHGEFAGFAVVVIKKDNLFFHSKALTGFYKYDPTLNAWLGYNPVSTEYGHPQKIYFYLGNQLCGQEEPVGPDKLPAYGTTGLVSKDEPHNDIILTNRTYGLELPREDTMIPTPVNQPLMETLDQIRDTFQLINPVKALEADCSSEKLNVSTLKVPDLSVPAVGQTVDSQKPVRVLLSHNLPASIGVVFYLNSADTADVDKIVYETAVGDIPLGQKGVLHCEEVPVPPADAATTQMTLHLFFYKMVLGRKILLGQDFHRTVSLNVK